MLDAVEDGRHPVICTGTAGSSGAYICAWLRRQTGMGLLIVLETEKKALAFYNDICVFLEDSGTPCLHFPDHSKGGGTWISTHTETIAKRVCTLYCLGFADNPPVVVTCISALARYVPPKSALSGYAELVMAEEELDRDIFIEKLERGGYTKTAIVEEPGDYTVRGGILDIFPPIYENPVRMEFFGDMVESLHHFSPYTQKRETAIAEIVVPPAKEVFLFPNDFERIKKRINMYLQHRRIPFTRASELIDRIRTEGVFPGLESFLPLVFEQPETILDYTGSNTRLVLVEPKDIQNSLDAQLQSFPGNREKTSDKKFTPGPEELFIQKEALARKMNALVPISFQMLPLTGKPRALHGQQEHTFHLETGTNTILKEQIFRKTDPDAPLRPLADWLSDNREKGITTIIPVASDSRAKHFAGLMKPYGIRLEESACFPEPYAFRGRILLCRGKISEGFVLQEEAVSVVTEGEIFGRIKRARKPLPAHAKTRVFFDDLAAGNLVVHMEHGIGRYQGLVKISHEGRENDFLKIEYLDKDILYLPVDRMNMVQKYMGVEGMVPTLDRLGGKTFLKTKSRIKKNAEKMAGELLKIYAERKVKKGISYSGETSNIKDFEAEFPYEETPDQKQVIEEVIRDMEKETPMDRLVCGDVGYGKTEVALRAAFIAVMNGKQVAVLVPTTVLAEQHLETFVKRFENYPVRIACLSRFRSSSEQKSILREMEAGALDIVIGTHRLLQKDVKFKDLGLVILDEEQRFGVRHKEKLKTLRATVDVLALSATPIPRSMHLSLLGVRDISIITTPPENRRAIITYISEFDPEVVRHAVHTELERGGQIFFVHNNIQSISAMAYRIQELVPELRLDIAHGRLSEDELERVMRRFVNLEIDMLVTTSIIESGLDIPSANTIMVNRADRFGLAQMYQLRGRVGRGNEQAYAYLFIPRDSVIGKDARKRLKVLMEHSDLGSGYQIAMNDLKIRGGGTILGASQSGHIAAVGYDMYIRLMDTAIRELKGEKTSEPLDPEINIPVSAFLPETYIEDKDLRLAMYRRISRLTDMQGIQDIKKEMTDRFGPLPPEAGNLLRKIMLRVLSIQAGVKRLDHAQEKMILFFSQSHVENPAGLTLLASENPDRFVFRGEDKMIVDISAGKGKNPLLQMKNALKEVIRHVNI